MLVGRFSLLTLSLLLLSGSAFAADQDSAREQFKGEWHKFLSSESCHGLSDIKGMAKANDAKWVEAKNPTVTSFLRGVYALEHGEFPPGDKVIFVQLKRDADWESDYVLFAEGNLACAVDTFIDKEGLAISTITAAIN